MDDPSEALVNDPEAQEFAARIAALADRALAVSHSLELRVRGMHKMLDSVAKGCGSVSCSAGCAFCCRAGEVHVSAEEVRLLKPHVPPEAWERARSFKGLSDEQAAPHACALLDPTTRRCTVYEHRPAVCRALLVISPPSQCEVGVGEEVAVLGRPKLAVSVIAGRFFGPNPFPLLLWRELRRLAPPPRP